MSQDTTNTTDTTSTNTTDQLITTLTQVIESLDVLNSLNTQINTNKNNINVISGNINTISSNILIIKSQIRQISGKLLSTQHIGTYKLLSGNVNNPSSIIEQNYIQYLIPTNIKLQILAQQIYKIYQNQTIVQTSIKSPVFILSDGNAYKQFKFYYDEDKKEIKYFNHIDDKDASEQDLRFIKRSSISQIHLKALQKVKLPMYIKFDFDDKIKYNVQSDDIDLHIKMNSKKNEKLYITLTNMSIYTKKIIINHYNINNTLKLKIVPEYDTIPLSELNRIY